MSGESSVGAAAASAPRRAREVPRPEQRPLKLAYVVSRFPKLTETFVLYELLAVEAQGVEVDLYPLLRHRDRRLHPEAEPLVRRARYQPFLSWPILRTQLWYLRRRRRAYLGALIAVARATFGSANFLLGALAIFPKAAHAARAMAAEGVDHVHCHFANHPAVVGFVVRTLEGIPYSFAAHGSDLHVDRHMLREKVAEAAFVVAVSAFNRELIVAECGERFRDKVQVIHCGVDTRRFRPTRRPPSAAPFRILCVGTLHEVKGQRYLLEALRLLVARGVDAACTFVGDGPDREALARRAAELGVAARVDLAGARTRGEVAQMLAAADVLAAPSVPTRSGKREGIPVALMEAMASGVPVVASRISGIPELVEDGVSGLLVPPGDPGALADALASLCGNPPLAIRLTRVARAKVEREFDLGRNARLLVRAIEAARAA